MYVVNFKCKAIAFIHTFVHANENLLICIHAYMHSYFWYINSDVGYTTSYFVGCMLA